jgi:hypothetical protein
VSISAVFQSRSSNPEAPVNTNLLGKLMAFSTKNNFTYILHLGIKYPDLFNGLENCIGNAKN